MSAGGVAELLERSGGQSSAAVPAFTQGRVSSAVPGMLGEVSASTHFHLVGNGQFVVDFQAGLLAAGVSEERVVSALAVANTKPCTPTLAIGIARCSQSRLPTSEFAIVRAQTTEKYFNGKAEADEAVVGFIKEAVGKQMAQPAA